jgi:hypothetical protein
MQISRTGVVHAMMALDCLACDACRLRCLGYSAKSCLGRLTHARFVLIRSVLNHLRVGRERMKRRRDGQCGDSGADPLGQGDAVLDAAVVEFWSK